MKKDKYFAPLIFIWLGSQLPAWGFESIRFARKNNKKRKIYLIINYKNKRNVNKNLNKIDINVFHISLDNLKSSLTKAINLNKSNNFWLFTSLRFEVLNYFIKHKKMKSFYHAEIDNLIFNFEDLDKRLNNIGRGIFVPRDGKLRAIASFFYCNKAFCLDELLSLYLEPFSAENDMHALGIYSNLSKDFYSLPTESYEFTKSMWKIIKPNMTEGLFDAAAIGQYCLGIDPRNNRYKPTYNLFENEYSKVNFKELKIVSDGFQLFLKSSEKEDFYKIYNIHVHSKDIKNGIAMINKDKIYESLIKKKKYLVAHRYKIIIGKILMLQDIIILKIKKLIKFLFNAYNI